MLFTGNLRTVIEILDSSDEEVDDGDGDGSDDDDDYDGEASSASSVGVDERDRLASRPPLNSSGKARMVLPRRGTEQAREEEPDPPQDGQSRVARACYCKRC